MIYHNLQLSRKELIVYVKDASIYSCIKYWSYKPVQNFLPRSRAAPAAPSLLAWTQEPVGPCPEEGFHSSPSGSQLHNRPQTAPYPLLGSTDISPGPRV